MCIRDSLPGWILRPGPILTRGLNTTEWVRKPMIHGGGDGPRPPATPLRPRPSEAGQLSALAPCCP
eukprot:8511805-Alexandrium_andersonii.AAC.1